MNKLLYLLLFLSPSFTFSASIDSLMIGNDKLYQHHIIRPQNKNLMIFLHGSISQFKNKKKSNLIPLDTLIEENSSFVNTFTDFGINLVFPIAYNQHNWLESSGDEYLSKIIEKYAKKHENIYICGFSDGGTGAYRYFHKFHEKLNGMILFNGFPQYENQHLKANHKLKSGKKIIYVSQYEDEVVPYEFSIVDYRRQKIVNQDTYLMISKGAHEFKTYTEVEFYRIIDLLNKPGFSGKRSFKDFWIHPPSDALIINNENFEIYLYRKKIGKQFGMNKQEYTSQQQIQTIMQELYINKKKMNFLVKIVPKKELESSDFLQFQFTSGIDTYTFEIENYLNIDTWDMNKNY